VAELYAKIRAWFRDQLIGDESEMARRRLERYDARDLTPEERAELRELAALKPPALVVVRGGAR
jgi:hypothetical protein